MSTSDSLGSESSSEKSQEDVPKAPGPADHMTRHVRGSLYEYPSLELSWANSSQCCSKVP
jgi:hypothetical protein